MYTSCGWFFDEVSGIETIQVIAYAGRVIQLAQKLFGPAGAALEDKFLEILSRAKSNLPEFGDGAELYRRYVLCLRVGLEEVGAHYAISSIFRSYPEDGDLFCYSVHREAWESFASGRGRVAVGRARIRSHITGEAEEICFAVLHLGDQNLSAAVRRFTPDDLAAFTEFSAQIPAAIGRADIPEVIRLFDRFFGGIPYSLTSLFADEQHRILRTILDRTVAEMEDSLRQIYEDHASLLRFLTDSGMAPPPALAVAANYAINSSLRRAMDAENFNSSELAALFSRATAYQVTLDTQSLAFAAADRIKRAMVALEMQLDIYNDALSKVPPSLPFASPIPPLSTESSALSAPIEPSAAAPIEPAGTLAPRTPLEPRTSHLELGNGSIPPSVSTPARNVAAALRTALAIAVFLRTLPFGVNLWQAQNIWNDLLRRNHLATWPDDWRADFKKLGQALYISVDSLVTEPAVPTF
jgi:hypothetical protein